MTRGGVKAYEYFSAFESGLTDEEVAQQFRVSLKTVERYRQLARYYDLAELEELVLSLRSQRAHVSTIFRVVRRDPRFRPFDSMILLAAICRLIKKAGRVISRKEVLAALRRAFNPRIHDEAQKEAIVELVASSS